MKKINILIFSLITINVLLSSYWLINGDIHYDVDVSRDLLVLDDIVRNKHLTFLGPRSGAIPGIFHGPLWFYVNLPAFLIGGGNPLVLGWFWFTAAILLLGILFWIAEKLFDFQTAVFSVLLFSANSIINPSIGLKNFYNPYGAVFLFPIFFYFLYQYINTTKIKYLITSLFLLGLIIQFQMAFGIPILLTITIFLAYFLFRKKILIHFLSYLILLIPLSTFILFDIKHNGLQFNSAVQFLGQNNSLLQNIFSTRINALFFDFFDFLSPGKNVLTVIFALFFLIMLLGAITKSVYPQKITYQLFGILFLGFWALSLFYQGGIGNYFWPFLPMVIIIFCSCYRFLKKEIFLLPLGILYLVNLYSGISAIVNFQLDVNKRGPHSWAFNYSVAQKIYQNAKQDFGYFTFSPDRFAYQQRYAMIFTQKEFPGITSFSSTKKPLTYLLEVDPPRDRPELNGTSWRISDIKIDRIPDQKFKYDFITVEKYLLSDDEIKVTPNPYLLDNVFLR